MKYYRFAISLFLLAACQSGNEGSSGVIVKPSGELEWSPPTVVSESHGHGNDHNRDLNVYGQFNKTMYNAFVVQRKVPGKRFPESSLRFARSEDGGVTWGNVVLITDDGSDFGSHNFHAMHVAQDGTIYVSWLDGRLGKSAAYMSHSSDSGRTWSRNTVLDAEPACPCCRTAVVSAADGRLYVAWRKVFPGNIRDVVVTVSSDTGKTWSKPVPVHNDNWVYDGCPHAGPSLAASNDGKVHVTWWTGRPDAPGVYYAVSSDGGKSFGTPAQVSAVARPTHPSLVVQDDSVFITWTESNKTMTRIGSRI